MKCPGKAEHRQRGLVAASSDGEVGSRACQGNESTAELWEDVKCTEVRARACGSCVSGRAHASSQPLCLISETGSLTEPEGHQPA